MRIQAFALAITLAFGFFTTACTGSVDVEDADDPGVAAPLPALKDSKLSPQEASTTTTTKPTTTTNSACAGSKVKTACNQAEQVRALL